MGDYHLAHPTRTDGLTPRPSLTLAQLTWGMLRDTSRICVHPGYNNWDISIQKYFPVHESIRFQFRLDMFNAFNHTNFYAPNTFLGKTPFDTPPGTFGAITSVMGTAADAGSAEAVLVMRADNQGLCCLLFDLSYLDGRCIFATARANLNPSWPRRNKPRPGGISKLRPSSTERPSPSARNRRTPRQSRIDVLPDRERSTSHRLFSAGGPPKTESICSNPVLGT